MKKTLTILAVLALAGCASTQTYKAPTQNYRLKGEDKAISINGAVFQKRELVGQATEVGIYLDEKLHIEVALDKNYTGEATGKPFNGKSTSATCSSKRTSSTNVQIDCIVFIDNERTSTLTF